MAWPRNACSSATSSGGAPPPLRPNRRLVNDTAFPFKQSSRQRGGHGRIVLQFRDRDHLRAGPAIASALVAGGVQHQDAVRRDAGGLDEGGGAGRRRFVVSVKIAIGDDDTDRLIGPALGDTAA